MITEVEINDVAPRVSKVLFQNGMNNLQKCFQS